MQVPVHGHLERPCASTLKILSWCFSLSCFLFFLYYSWQPGYIPQSYLGALSFAKIVSIWQLVITSLWLQNFRFSCHRNHQMLYLPGCFCFRQLCFQIHESGGVVRMHIYLNEKKSQYNIFMFVLSCLHLFLSSTRMGICIY